jgi:hypothetical protein
MKMRLVVCALALTALSLLVLITGSQSEKETQPAIGEKTAPESRQYAVFAAEPGAGGKLAFTLKQGDYYVFTFKAWEMEITTEPQMAFWLEDTSGNCLATVYVTFKYATQDWFVPSGVKREGVRRPSSLPIWTQRHQKKGIQEKELCRACHERHKVKGGPAEPEPPLDAVTGSTPRWGFTREWAIPLRLEPGEYTVLAEINNAMDPNDTYWVPSAERPPDEDDRLYGGTSGQPSVLWSGILEVSDSKSSTELVKSGHGHPAGRDGNVTADLGKLTTALQIVESIRVDYTPPE